MPRYRLTVRGVVQGVGFRPFVKRLADRERLSGLVYNTGDGVVIEIETEAAGLAAFADRLRREKPPLAVIEECLIETSSPGADFGNRFIIEASLPRPGAFTLVSPDIATCADCLAEIRNPADRRFRYPFTNCTNCGPRYTIIRKTPYDRAKTTMAPFAMCAACAAEYADAGDRPLPRRAYRLSGLRSDAKRIHRDYNRRSGPGRHRGDKRPRRISTRLRRTLRSSLRQAPRA
jgi:hydrogenase maturation protein HypF